MKPQDQELMRRYIYQVLRRVPKGRRDEARMELEELKKLCALHRSGACCDAQIRLLRKCRCRLLEQIHCQQQALDRLDYLIYELKNTKG